MIVSKNHIRDAGSQRTTPEQVAALGWLQRQLAWERVLDGLRRAAGVSPLSAVPAPADRRMAASDGVRPAA